MNTDGTGFNTCKECNKTESLWNHTTTDHKEGEKLEDRRNVGASSCNSGDGTDQSVQSLMFMVMMMMMMMMMKLKYKRLRNVAIFCLKLNAEVRIILLRLPHRPLQIWTSHYYRQRYPLCLDSTPVLLQPAHSLYQIMSHSHKYLVLYFTIHFPCSLSLLKLCNISSSSP